MPIPYETAFGSWSRRSTFFWAATGATVGLSNLWKFPFLAGENGGGLFVLLYLACLLLVTLPLMLTETALGRQARHGIVLAVDGLARDAGRSLVWVWLARLSLVAGFLVLSFTAVIGAICLAYVFYGAFGLFVGAGEGEIALTLAELVEDPSEYRDFMAWHVAFLGLVMAVSMQGVVLGLERAFRVVVPTFLLILIGLLAYSHYAGELTAGSHYILGMRPEQVSWQSLQLALAHAFYTLGLGMGVWVVFGAYMPDLAPLKRSVFAVALMDTLIAIMAGLAIYGLVLRTGPAAEQGFALVFLALPASLADAPGSQFVATACFIAILLVAWTTSLALLEPAVGWFREWTGAPRGWSVIIMGVAVWAAGLGTLYSFNLWSEVTFQGGTVFRWVELVASGLLVPAVSVALAVFVGWKLGSTRALRMIGRAPRLVAAIWFWALKLVLPLVVFYIGAHYAWSSLTNLCEGQSSAVWCQAQPVLPGEAGESLLPEGRAQPRIEAGRGHRPLPDALKPNAGEPALLEKDEPAGETPVPEAEPQSTPEAQPGSQDRGEEATEEMDGAAKDDEILYHSV
ncbi:MAG: sodium-dependent transporter [Marinobacter sp.]|uniref:sodium-dependent transporter n=1 Tax=Marinobacter sp. TaxID=50741 RepID=UPI00299D97B0|nr:sodium-dependent transporter [Marinobacter sp.]MDX1636007.1 sodium-dependent transporter [Marinobacter sp.]